MQVGGVWGEGPLELASHGQLPPSPASDLRLTAPAGDFRLTRAGGGSGRGATRACELCQLLPPASELKLPAPADKFILMNTVVRSVAGDCTSLRRCPASTLCNPLEYHVYCRFQKPKMCDLQTVYPKWPVQLLSSYNSFGSAVGVLIRSVYVSHGIAEWHPPQAYLASRAILSPRDAMWMK